MIMETLPIVIASVWYMIYMYMPTDDSAEF